MASCAQTLGLRDDLTEDLAPKNERKTVWVGPKYACSAGFGHSQPSSLVTTDEKAGCPRVGEPERLQEPSCRPLPDDS